MQIFKFIVKPRAEVYSLIALYLSRCRVAGGLHLTQPVGCLIFSVLFKHFISQISELTDYTLVYYVNSVRQL